MGKSKREWEKENHLTQYKELMNNKTKTPNKELELEANNKYIAEHINNEECFGMVIKIKVKEVTKTTVVYKETKRGCYDRVKLEDFCLMFKIIERL